MMYLLGIQLYKEISFEFKILKKINKNSWFVFKFGVIIL